MRKVKRGSRRSAMVLAVALAGGSVMLATGGSALAQTSQWVGGNSADWNTASHWSPSGVPGTGYDVNVTSSAGVTQTISYNYTGPAVALGTLTLNLFGGSGNASETINMSANTLSATEEDVGGYNQSNGSGTFNQSGGNNNIVDSFTLALYGGTGTYNLSAGSLTDSMSAEWIGYGGTGVFNQTGGNNTIVSGDAGLYLAAGGTGTYNLSAGSLTAAQEALGLDGGATAIFNQTGGNNTLVPGPFSELDLGFSTGAVGNYTISGGTTTIDTNVFIGGGGAAFVAGPTAAGSGNLTISNTGQMTVVGTIWLFPGTQNSLNLTGGSLTVGILNLNNSYSQFFWTGGTLTLTGASGENITIDNTSASNFGDSSGTASSFVLGTGQTLNVYGYEYVGYNGTGNFTQTGGTNFINLNLVLGQNAGSTGTYTLSGSSSSLSVVGSIRVGFNGTGIFIQNGGDNTVTNNVSLAFNSGSGTYILNGGTLNAGANVNVGGQNSGPGGTGVLTVGNGAVLTIGGNLNVYDTAGTVVNLAGGTIVANALNFNGNPSLLNWTSGELNVNSNVTWDSAAAPTTTSDAFGASIALGNGQILVVSGNETLGGTGPFTLTLNTGSNHTVTGKLTVSSTPGSLLNLNGGTLNANALTVASGALFRGSQAGIANINATATISGTVNLDGETSFFAGNISIPNGGLLALNNAFVSATTISISSGGQVLMNNSATSELNANISNSGQITGAGQIFGTLTNNSDGVLNVNSTQTLLVTGSGSTNTGIINLGGGTLDFTQALNNSGTIQGFGALTVSGNLTIASTGTLALAGSSSVSGNVTNKSGGTIHLSGNQPNVFFNTVANAGLLTVDAGASGTFYGVYSGAGPITNNGSLFINATSIAGAISGTGTLTLGSGVTPANLLLSTGSGASKLVALTLNSTSRLDLTNNPLILEAASAAVKPGDIAQLAAKVLSGRNGGAWNGPGITSSTVAANPTHLSIAIADNALLPYTTFGGQSVDSNSILVVPAVLGDANLDGIVNAADFTILASNFNASNVGWTGGNFNNDGVVNFADFAALSNDFGDTFAAIGAAMLPASASGVPEPASLVLLGVGLLGLTGRRRTRSLWPRNAALRCYREVGR